MKLTTWNAEWLEDNWGVVSGKYAPESKRGRKKMPTMERAQAKVDAFTELADRIAPDILFVCEGPMLESETEAFAAAALPDHQLVKRPVGQKSFVKGDQGLWFFVRKSMVADLDPTLLDVAIWRNFTHQQVDSFEASGRWWAVRPKLQDFGDVKDVPVNVRKTHGHHRQPQVLRITVDGQMTEIIGVHMKSKFTGKSVRKRKPSEDFEDYSKEPRVARYLAASHEARVKLTSEASNIRGYIDHRFEQEAAPSILLLGDVNDGPGKELMEREYLLHDMISNLQGEIFFAQRMLYHVLFDQPRELRWTSRFKDKIDPERDEHILLDHILYTQAMNRVGASNLMVEGHTGRVEHRDYEEVQAIFGEKAMSDHRPISVSIVKRGGTS